MRRLLCVAALLGPLCARANTPLSDFPCSDKVKQQAAASTAELAKKLGKKVEGSCSCFEEDCAAATLTYELPFEATPTREVTLHLERSVDTRGLEPLKPVVTAAGLAGFVRKASAHPLLVALFALGPTKCRLTSHRGGIGLDCASSLYAVGLWGEKPLVKQYFRMPLEALTSDPEWGLAKKDPKVAAFVAGKSGVVAEYSPNSPRRLCLKFGGAPASPFAQLEAKEAFTVFFKIPHNGVSDVSQGVEAVCAGERFSECR